MNLLSTSQDLQEKLERIESANRDDQIVRQLEQLHEKAQELVRLAETTHSSTNLLITADVQREPLADKISEIDSLQTNIDKVRARTRKNPATVSAGNTWATANELAKNLPRKINQSLLKEWKNFVSQEVPSIDIYISYRDLEQCSATIAEMESLHKEGSRLGEALPSIEGSINRVREIGASIRGLIESLQLDGEPDEMLDFLKRCPAGVPMDELTDEILAWLREKGFTANLKVTTTSRIQ